MTYSCTATLSGLLFVGVGVTGCGEIAIGTLAAVDGGSTPSTARDDAGVTLADGGTKPVTTSCPAQSGEEGLFDVAANAADNVTDFFGDGERVFVGINVIANFQAGRIDIFGQTFDATHVVNISPYSVRRIGPGKDTVIYDVDRGSGGILASVPRAGGKPIELDVGTPPPFASHPDRNEAFFLTHETGPAHDVVRLWNPALTTPPPPAMVLPASLAVQTFATDATELSVVVADTTSIVPSFKVLHPPKLAGGGPYEEIASLSADVVSNVVVRDAMHFVATRDATGVINVYRFNGPNTTVDQSLVGSVLGAPTDGVRIEVDDTYVYIAHGMSNPSCSGNPRCSTGLEVERMKRTGTKNSPGHVKSFVGWAPGLLMTASQERFRAFNVDGCWFYWYDAAKRILFRQAKGSF